MKLERKKVESALRTLAPVQEAPEKPANDRPLPPRSPQGHQVQGFGISQGASLLELQIRQDLLNAHLICFVASIVPLYPFKATELPSTFSAKECVSDPTSMGEITAHGIPKLSWFCHAYTKHSLLPPESPV